MHPQSEPIAIVGSACRFPGSASSPSALWELLKEPRDVCAEIPADRFNTTGFYHPDGSHHGATNVRHSYLLQEDLRHFDAAFFNISPNEADSMDPQQRLLLETVYEALEAGGHPIEKLRGSDTAVYTGTMGVDYNDTGVRDLSTVPTYFATGVNRAIISNRVSYFFDWHGPSMTIDTACSSSLVAVHQGVRALRSGESRVALACGTQVILNPEMYVIESKLKMLSPTGRSRMWDANADGYARGEGVAAVVLKRLSDALADGDHIECLLRETGSNQDGHSNGITVPSTEAQAALIRQTYARAGLNPELNAADRPQFFEAHGTGTKAGDPKEAAAIYQTFGQHQAAEGDVPLYVGSVKTVIGHLEGSAGLAGLLKGSASIQNGFIAPNLLFNTLNPDIEPFYQGLQVPTELTPWPQLPEGVPRRVSVNSFGFGGTNAHAILEQYIPASSEQTQSLETSVTPFVFSALNEESLVAQLRAYSTHLKDHPDINPVDLAWTLQSRRSQLATRVAFSAADIETLVARIDAKLAPLAQNPGIAIGTRVIPKSAATKILGVFTGQGAQWAAMGAELIRSSAFAQRRLEELEKSLDSLPDGPQWRLQEELLAEEGVSRIGEAALSQPLCTAVQIVLVDLLRAAGVDFAAVVGHSSGEMGAAYAAGFLSAHDAIRIAYYRGVHARLAGNAATGQKGAMLAVGTSWEDAQDLIRLKAFKGRIAVAAHNSGASVTLSGDVDAIQWAKRVFDEEKKFARLLKVDTAYHSHHMVPCGDAYVASLRACGVQVNVNRPENSPAWFSSVIPSDQEVAASEDLNAVYWRDNMTNSVLFADAVRNAVASDDQIGLALEIGPHPALKGPAMQNIADVRPSPIPYSGVLSRGANDVAAVSDALGFLWTHLGSLVDFQGYHAKFTDTLDIPSPRLIVGLPSYRWTHSRLHWHESRRSRKLRSRPQATHELLGSLLPESTAHDLHWSNVLKVSEVPWLDGHQLQGQTVFPAAGYVTMALEAARTLGSPEKPIQLLELQNIAIPRAITFEDGDTSGVETLVALGDVHYTDNTATATFSCHSLPVMSTGSEQEMELAASAIVKISFGEPDDSALSSVSLDESSYNLYAIDADRLYTTLDKLGYGYSGPFRTLTSIQRRLNYAVAQVGVYPASEGGSTPRYWVHPSTLDVAFQAGMAAFSAPGDERLWSLHVPTGIRSLRVNPPACITGSVDAQVLPVAATIDGTADTFSAYIDILAADSEQCIMQIEDLTIKPFAPASANDDRVLFTSTVLGTAVPDGVAVAEGVRPTEWEVELAHACERIAYYYLRKWDDELTDADWANGQPHHRYLRDWVNRTLDLAYKDQHATLLSEWVDDGPEDIEPLIARYPDNLDVRMIVTVGEKIPPTVRGETTILEHLLKDNMLDDFYQLGSGFQRYNKFLATMMKQITHRYPHLRILEIGAGTGGATKYVLKEMGDSMASYTYTDISVGFFPKAAEIFAQWSSKMTFKIFDAEKAPAAQGYVEGSYDIVIASNVLHATASLHTTLVNARKLLRPGGYLLLLEITNNEPIRTGFVWGTLAGWWLGVDDNRRWAPTITPGEWHTALRNAGYAGVDAVTPEIDGITWPFSIMAAQAVDDRVSFLRQPLSASSSSSSSSSSTTIPSVSMDSLVILGQKSLDTAHLAEQLAETLQQFAGEVILLDGLPTEDEALDIPPMSTFINLVDLDAPIFKNPGEEQMTGLQRMLDLAKHVLWITQGALVEQPYHMASITFSRAVRREAAHVSLNHLDVTNVAASNRSRAIAQHLLQQFALNEWETGVNGDQTLLWSREPEAFLDGGKLLLPRLISNEAQNARLNASRRGIVKELPIASANLAMIPPSATASMAVVEASSIATPKGQPASLARVSGSSVMALSLSPDTFLFLGTGKDVATQRPLLLLSKTNSVETVPVASVSVDTPLEAEGLVATASELLAESLLGRLSSSSHLLVHCSAPDASLASALAHWAASASMRVSFIGNDRVTADGASWVQLRSGDSQYVVRTAIQRVQPTHYLDLVASTSEVSLRLAQALPSACQRIEMSTLIRPESAVSGAQSDGETLTRRLHDAYTRATQSRSAVGIDVDDITISVDNIPSDEAVHPTTVVHWPSEGLVKAEIRPLQTTGLFSRDKTYLLVGLSGKIGQSLTEWMVANGAGTVCLTSRSPQIDDRWIRSFNGTGATVRIYAMDVTDVRSVRRVVKEIRATCAPIAGLANGAMVLHDTLFSKMTTEQMQKVLGPKIDGSNILDRVFYKDDLDFFVFFSSASSVVGNVGQSNYTAANGYINSLARQRRRRGVAASTFDIGQVAGVGYIETAGQAVMDQLASLGLRPLSETDLRQAFAETIRAGRPDPQDVNKGSIPDAVLTTGIRYFAEDEDIKGPWFSNAFFAHCVIESKTVDIDPKDQDKKSSIPAAKQLVLASSKEQALDILQECFAAKLRVVLQLSDQAIDYDAPLVDLGIDSLVAVEVRSWFLKEVKVDIPVLKVVGGASLAELCQRAMDKLPEELLVGIGKEPSSSSSSSSKKPEEAIPTAAVPLQSQSPRSASGSTTPSEDTESVSAGNSSTNSDGGASSASDTEASTRSASPVDSTRGSSKGAARVSSAAAVEKLTAEVRETLTTPSPSPVAKRARRFIKSVPISFGQSRFWFLQQLLANQRTHNVAYYYHVRGTLSVPDLERAVRVVTNRHEGLRTCFVPDEIDASQAYQKVLPSSPVRLITKTIHARSQLDAEYAQLRTHELDLASGELLRLVLLTDTQTTDSHYLLVYHHHIIMDGLSLQVFLADLETAYNGESLGPAPKQYPEFSLAQRQAVENGEMEPEFRFWRGIFPAGEQPPVLPLLPMARTQARVPMVEYDTHQVQHRIEPGLAARIRSVARAHQSSPFHLYLAAFKALLFCFTDTDDLTIGVADGARNESSVMGSIGFFLNLLTLRFRRQPRQSFAQAVIEARQTAHAALENSRLPFDVLLTELNIERNSTHSPFFQAFIDYRQGLQEKQAFGNCQLEMSDEVHTGKTAYDLTVDITDGETDAVLMVRAQKSLYDQTATQLLCDTYVHFLNTVTADPSLALDAIPRFSEQQVADAVQIGRGTELVSDWPETLPRRIDQVAQANPDKVALMDGTGAELTYHNMIDRIEAIAEALQDAGVRRGDRVLVFQMATADWPCSMLAIMRLGAIYVPLDLRNPVLRLAGVARDCDPIAVLADDSTLLDAPQLGVSARLINVADVGASPSSHTRIPNVSLADDTAAILYTSGSTGTPKGIVVTHAGLRNEIEGYTKMWKLGAERVLQQSAFTFNHSSDQMYTGLVNGGMVYIVPWDKRGNPIEITQILANHGITYTKATPSEYSLWMQYGADHLRHATSWRAAFGGGESLTTAILQEFADLNLPQLQLFNSYGPTEISISSTKMAIEYRGTPADYDALKRTGRVPCGFSLPNYHMYVVDGQLRPMPAGMPGQLAIGGAGVSRGYLGNTELTEKHFVPNPFATEGDITQGWTRMYLTGDIGHLEPDGAMVFHSRMAGDTQVKIRGLRIELADIESNIVTASEGVLRDAVVTLREGNPEFLVAHVVFAPQQAVVAMVDSGKEVFLQQLLNRLAVPQYMVPVVAIPLDELPLTNHSKVDRKLIKSLPLPDRVSRTGADGMDEEIDIEWTEAMRRLRALWWDVLGKTIEQLGLDIRPSTSFFLVGGNSLLIIRLQSRIRREFDVALSLVDLLGANTLAQMARKIEDAAAVKAIDWDTETAPATIPESLSLSRTSLGLTTSHSAASPSGRVILLTGATGFLARFLLPQLDAHPDVGTIHCVAVRDPHKLAYSSPNIITHPGDLSAPLLGLSEESFHELAGTVDVILHLGAARSFWDSYHVLRATNVLSTRNLVMLAAPRGIPIHYMSTGAVLGTTTTGAVSAAGHWEPPTDGSEGYTATRWASERILERSTESLGVPSFVHRFLPAFGQQNTQPLAGALDEFTRCAQITGTIPDLEGWTGRLDLLPADTVAHRLCVSVLDSTLQENHSQTEFQHLPSTVTVSGADLAAHIQQHVGVEGLEKIPVVKWIGRVKKAGFVYFLASHRATIQGDTEGPASVQLQMQR